jgi:hypothetical protein
MPLGQRRPPSADLVRRQIDNAAVAELARRLRQEPAQLRDRARLRLMLGEVLVGQLAKRDLHWSSAAPMQPLERDLQRLHCPALTREPARLRPCRATTLDAIAIRPRGLAIRAARFQLEHLSLLRHHQLLLALDTWAPESPSRSS